jgi:hypothetical protein
VKRYKTYQYDLGSANLSITVKIKKINKKKLKKSKLIIINKLMKKFRPTKVREERLGKTREGEEGVKG